jgi:pyruvate formate lyase activating enzyme
MKTTVKGKSDNLSDLLLPIGGVTPFTTIDCPDKISSVFFLQGCHLNCGYCHNKHFKPVMKKNYPFSKYIEFLNERKNFIEAIVFSGGEPFLHFSELTVMAKKAHSLGFEIALHTTGSFPEKLERFLNEIPVFWVGIDLKAPENHYKEITGTKVNYFANTVKSIGILAKHKINFEARTTVDSNLAQSNNLKKLISTYNNLGIENPVLQPVATNGKQNIKIKTYLQNFVKGNKLTNVIIR